MQKAIILFVITLFSFTASSEDLKNKILKISELREGTVTLKEEQDESCQEGALFLQQVEGEEGLTLMLGSHPLVFDLGVKKPKVTIDRNCSDATLSVNVKKGLIRSKREQTCNGITTTYLMSVKAGKDGFEYHRKNFTKGQIFIDLTCEYSYNK